MDWRQWQNVAKSNDLSNVWNRQQTTPPWMRPGDQRPPVRGPGYNQGPGYSNNPSGQPRPGVHPDDWNNRQPGTGSGYAGNNMNWPSNQPNQNQQNQDGRDRNDRERTRNERRRNRNKNRRKDSNNDRQRNDEVLMFHISCSNFEQFVASYLNEGKYHFL